MHKADRNKEETGEDAARAEHRQYVVDVPCGDQQHQQNEAQVGEPIEQRLGARGDIRETRFDSQRARQRKQHEQKQRAGNLRRIDRNSRQQ